MKLDLESFLKRNRIDSKTWNDSEISQECLELIYQDYLSFANELTDCAEIYAKKLQRMDKVHSVRWRVKDPEHVLEKIIRKRADKNEKYAEINNNNYYNIITDLVGVRAIHLFKEDFSILDQQIRNTWPLAATEKPTFNLREGDPKENIDPDLFEVRHHPAGYRSVHYIATSQPGKRTIHLELQVRTLFEEGWSEIDHTIRYPNFSNNNLINYFLTIFNRLAGSADEMGSFVRNLTSVLEESEEEIRSARAERDKALEDMERTISELSQLRQKAEGTEELIEKLKRDIITLKGQEDFSKILRTKHFQAGEKLGFSSVDPREFSAMLRSLKTNPTPSNINADLKTIGEILRNIKKP